jgi:hypothetical protein
VDRRKIRDAVKERKTPPLVVIEVLVGGTEVGFLHRSG